jgi:hypothetical protein
MTAFLQESGSATGASIAGSTTIFQAYGDTTRINGTTEAPTQLTFRNPGVISLLGIRIIQNLLTGNATLTLRKNGANGNSIVTIAAGLTGYFEDTINTDSIIAGDVVNYQIVTGTGISIFPTFINSLFAATTGTIIHYVTISAGTTFSTASLVRANPVAGALTPSGVENSSQVKAKSSFTLRNLYVYISANTRTTASTVVSRKNGANGNLLVTIPGGVTGIFEDIINSDSLVNGDLYNYFLTLGLLSGSITFNVIATEGFTSGSNNLQYICSVLFNSQNSNLTNFKSLQGGLANASTESFVATKTNVNGVLSNMAIFVSTNTLNGTTIITLRKNFLSGNQTITVPNATTGYFEDTINTDIITTADKVNYQVVTAGSSGVFQSSTQTILIKDFTPVSHSLAELGCGN